MITACCHDFLMRINVISVNKSIFTVDWLFSNTFALIMHLTGGVYIFRMGSMQQRDKFKSICVAGASALSVAIAAALSSCGDDNSFSSLYDKLKGKEEAPSAPEAVPSEKATAISDQQKDLFRYFLFSVADEVRRQADQPVWIETVRDMRNKIEAYYNAEKANRNSLSEEDLVSLGLLLGDATRDLAAYEKAKAFYETAQKDWEAMPEEVRKSVNGRRLSSAIANSMGYLCLVQRKMSDALPYYEKALQIDRALYDELAPADGAPLPVGEGLSADLAKAAEDVLSSYRCLGDAQFFADDPELARDTYSQGQALATRMNNLTPAIALQYVRLLSALGNLENSVGNPKKALASWVEAAKRADTLRRMGPSIAVQLQTVRYLRELEQSIKTVHDKLARESQEKKEEPASQPEATHDDPTAPEESAEEPAEEPAPVPAS